MADASTKKGKQFVVCADALAKKSKEKHGKKSSTAKGKGRETGFLVVKTFLVLSIPPIFANNPRAGAEEMLDSMLMRYIPALRGVVLSHSNIKFLSNTASLKAECPFLVCKIEFDATIWSPRVGMKLVGKVNLCSPDHVSLLLHRTFNVSIPRHHIPREEWIFEYGPAENDPEFGPDALQVEEGSISRHDDGGGKWVHHLTHERLGGSSGSLEFTVIGLTVANEMLSLLGSMQLDPFSSEHVPEIEKGAKASFYDDNPESREVSRADEEESDPDPFDALAKEGSRITAADAELRRETELDIIPAREKRKHRSDQIGQKKKQRRAK